MDMYNTRFTVHADYIDPGVPLWIILALIAGIVSIVSIALLISLLITAPIHIRKNIHVGLPTAAILLITGILLTSVAGSQYLSYYEAIEDSQAPSVDEVIAAPEGCAIASNRVIKAEGSSVAGINLPDGQKRATYEVEASCQDNDSLDGLNALNNKIIFLDQQPLAP